MKIIKEEQGAVLMVAMVMLVILTSIGMAAIQTSVFEMRIADAETRKQAAFYAAEAGLSRAKSRLGSGGFTAFTFGEGGTITGIRWNIPGLSSTDKLQFVTGNLTYSSRQQFSYTVDIWDNGDSNDDLIFARSTAVGSNGGSAGVEVLLTLNLVDADTEEGTVQIDQQEGSSSEKANVGYDADAMDTSGAGLSRQI